MKEDILVNIGLTRSEAKAYLTLLELGLSGVTEISKISKLHRSNSYDALKKLISRGLVSKIEQGNVTFYSASEPKSLMMLLKAKENQLQSIIPQLELSKNMSQSAGHASVSEGLQSLFNLLYGFLDFKEDILLYGIPDIAPEVVKFKIGFFHEERIKQKINMLHIYNHNAQERIVLLNTLKYTVAKYLPAKYDSQVTTFICGDQVAFVTWDPITVITVSNKNLSKSYKSYFHLLWKDSK